MSGYKADHAAQDTKASVRDVKSAWHQARDDASVRGNRDSDRPTRQNREDARALTDKIIKRGRDRDAQRAESSRDER